LWWMRATYSVKILDVYSTILPGSCDSVKFLGLVGWGDESLYEKRNGWDPHPKKRAQCSNLCIVTSKRRVTQIYVTICLGFFFPRKFLFPLPQSVLPSGEAGIWKVWAASRGCFNRLYKYLHPHGLTPWTTYYSISLFLFLFLSCQGSGADMLLFLCHSSIKHHSLTPFVRLQSSSTAYTSFDLTRYSWGILEVEAQLPDQICPLDM